MNSSAGGNQRSISATTNGSNGNANIKNAGMVGTQDKLQKQSTRGLCPKRARVVLAAAAMGMVLVSLSREFTASLATFSSTEQPAPPPGDAQFQLPLLKQERERNRDPSFQLPLLKQKREIYRDLQAQRKASLVERMDTSTTDTDADLDEAEVGEDDEEEDQEVEDQDQAETPTIDAKPAENDVLEQTAENQNPTEKVHTPFQIPTSGIVTAQGKACAAWDTNMDAWWQEHPDWEPSPLHSNDTHGCFRLIANAGRAQFYRTVHYLQFNNSACHKMAVRTTPRRGKIIQSFDAAVHFFMDGFYSAFREQRPFVLPYNQTLTSSLQDCSGDNISQWTCHLLPISSCTLQNWDSKQNKGYAPRKQYFQHDVDRNPNDQRQMIWLHSFLLRPKQAVRQQMYQVQQRRQQLSSSHCTVVLIGRDDAAAEISNNTLSHILGQIPSYGQTSSKTIILLSRNEKLLETARMMDPDHQLILPLAKNDILYWFEAMQLAGSCRTLVYSDNSDVNIGMIRLITSIMKLEHGVDQIRTIRVEAEKDLMATEQKPVDLGTTKPAVQYNQTQPSLLAESSPSEPTTSEIIKCAPWAESLDDWWQERPDFEVRYDLENDTHTCLGRMLDPKRVDFIHEVYNLQFNSTPGACSSILYRFIVGTGYAASMGRLLQGFWTAYRTNRPFQASKHWHGFKWMYSPPYDFNNTNIANMSWAACPSNDMFCYFLPISSCERGIGRDKDEPIKTYLKKELETNPHRQQQFVWLFDYFMRPRQEVRWRLRQLLNQQSLPPLTSKCTVFHVRRADATTERAHKRNFYPLQRYLDMGNMTKHSNETILLLTDDQTTLDEAHLLHPEYAWVYLNRTRYRGAVRRNSHVPSGDEAWEVLVILAEFRLASNCQRLVRGTSNMVNFITRAMMLRHGVEGITDIQIDRDIDWKKQGMIPGKDFVKNLDKKLAEATGIMCLPWSNTVDNFWQEHPDFELGDENRTHSCFRKVQNPARARFLRELRASQFPLDQNCSTMASRNLYGVGFGAAIEYLVDGFWGAFTSGRPYQHSRKDEGFRWMYIPKYIASKKQVHWAGCKSQDIFCYFLPLSRCKAEIGTKEFMPRKPRMVKELKANRTLREQHSWLTSYAMRPNVETRRHLVEFMHSSAVPEMQTPCTVLHVRRADATTENSKFPRNFYSVEEYLTRGNVSQGENVLLMTDDEIAIEEAHLLHPEYQWMYVNRTRHRGATRKNKHIPSNDMQLEMLIILAELQLSGHCRKVVHGTSHIATLIQTSMVVRHGLDNVESIRIDNDIDRNNLVDAKEFAKEMEKKLTEARKAASTTK